MPTPSCKTLYKSFISALIMGSAVFVQTPAHADEAPTLNINGKTITGVVDADHFIAFKGIKFGQAPVGDLRWAPTVANEHWADKGTFTKFEATCATGDSLGVFGKTSDEEDCLYLNVFVPKNLAKGETAPVMAWIAGGGLGTGSGNDYNPAFWTDRGVIVVTFNYRVGIFGFFSDTAIDADNKAKGLASVNYGLLDQQEALKWVQENIAAFGGDPKKVTIYGESAGGHSVLGHMVAPGSAGLFQSAIASSGSYTLNQMSRYQLRNIHSQPMVAKTACAAQDGAARVACLRGLPTKDVIAAAPSYLAIARFIVDPETMPLGVFDAFRTGAFNRVPLINGNNNDEGTFFTWISAGMPKTRDMSGDSFKGALNAFLGPYNMRKVIGLITPPADGNYFNLGVRYLGDARFVCRTPLLASLAAQYTDTYLYKFSPVNPPMYLDAGFPLQATHTSDLPYVFKDFSGAQGFPAKLRPENQKLSSYMMAAFVNFIKTGSPGMGWSKTSQNEEFMSLEDEKQVMMPNYSKAKNCYGTDIIGVLDSPFY